jgi:hypothetical protein
LSSAWVAGVRRYFGFVRKQSPHPKEFSALDPKLTLTATAWRS